MVCRGCSVWLLNRRCRYRDVCGDSPIFAPTQTTEPLGPTNHPRQTLRFRGHRNFRPCRNTCPNPGSDIISAEAFHMKTRSFGRAESTAYWNEKERKTG